MADFYQGSYGAVRLWMSQIQTAEGRNLMIFEPTSGNEFPVEDLGENQRAVQVDLLFDWMGGDQMSPIDRLQALRAEIDDKPRVFRHPLLGSYVARFGAFDHTVDEDSTITGHATVVREQRDAAVDSTGSSSVFASSQSVSVSATKARDQLTELRMDTSAIDEAEATVESWAEADDPDPRQMRAEAGSVRERLGAVASSLETDLDAYSSWAAVMQLAEDVSSAYEAATSDTAETFVMRLGEPVAARALLASVYGADEADQRYEQFIRLNDVDNPLRLVRNAEYLMPPKTPKGRTS